MVYSGPLQDLQSQSCFFSFVAIPPMALPWWQLRRFEASARVLVPKTTPSLAAATTPLASCLCLRRFLCQLASFGEGVVAEKQGKQEAEAAGHDPLRLPQPEDRRGEQPLGGADQRRTFLSFRRPHHIIFYLFVLPFYFILIEPFLSFFLHL